MASSLSSLNSTTTIKTSSSSFPCPFSHKNTQISVIRTPKHHQLFTKVICQARKNDNSSINGENGLIDRRNMLIGLGVASLYGITSNVADHSVMAAPIVPPDLSKCGAANLPSGATPTNCCPPTKDLKIIDFTLPSSTTPLRVRPAAHFVDDAYIAKYTKAYEHMRALPDDDPRSFKQEANVHCAYFDGAYDQQVKDCLDQANFGYKYQDVEIPWLKTRPLSRRARAAPTDKKAPANEKAAAKKKSAGNNNGFPIALNSVVRVMVKRPKQKARSKKEKEEEEEILVIEGIELERDTYVKFDVLINEADGVSPDKSEFAGSFVNVPHKHGKKATKSKTCLRLGITDLLEDLDAEDDDDIMVTLGPRQGKDVTIDGINIVFAS